MLNDGLYVREALLGRMRQASFAGTGGTTAALATGGPTLAYARESGPSLPAVIASAVGQAGARAVQLDTAAVPATTYWTQGLGAWGRFGGDRNGADARRTLTGFFSGVDHRFDPHWLAGIAGGYTNASVNVGDRASSARIETAHLAGYAAATYGSWNLRAAAASNFSTLSTNRTIAFPGFAETTTARYDAMMAQVFGEVSYGVTVGRIAAEPFGGLAFAHLRSDGFAETSGSGMAALDGSASRDHIGYAMLGGRVATSLVQQNGMVLTPRLSAAWQHVIGPLEPTQASTFQSTGAPFTIAGLPLARDAAVLEGGFDLHINPQARLGLSYAPQFGRHHQHSSVQGNLTWRF